MPVFLLGCVVAWMAAGATGWIWGILAFVITLICGALSLRAGCQIAFPDLPTIDSPEYADPELFAPSSSAITVDEISPGLLDDGLEDDPNVMTQHSDDASQEDEASATNMFDSQDLNMMEEEANLFQRSLDAVDGQDVSPTAEISEVSEVTDEDAFSREVERMMHTQEQEAAQTEVVPDEAPPTANVEPEADAMFAPQPSSERPSLMSDDPGRRLAQSLVMVGASPAHERAATSAQSVSLRPATLNSARSTGPDDFKLIRGIGTALEDMLHRLGYFHFDQIAAWTPEEVRWVDENLDGFKGRVSRDHWVSQAIVLAQSHRSGDGIASITPNLRPSAAPDSNT